MTNILFCSLSIALELSAGDVRFPGQDGEVTMTDHYGYVVDTEGADGEEIDVYVAPDISQLDVVYRVSQRRVSTGELDEHKYMLGYASKQAAIDAYMRNMPGNAPLEMFASIDEISMENFKKELGL